MLENNRILVSRNMDMMDIDKIIEKTQQYERLRSELITEIQFMVSRARTLTEWLNSLAATDDSINDISEYEMYEELYCLEGIDENNDLEMTRYFDLVIDLKYKLDSLEELLGNKIRWKIYVLHCNLTDKSKSSIPATQAKSSHLQHEVHEVIDRMWFYQNNICYKIYDKITRLGWIGHMGFKNNDYYWEIKLIYDVVILQFEALLLRKDYIAVH